MGRLISVATGRRPVTAEACFHALRLQVAQDDAYEVTVVQWSGGLLSRFPTGFRHLTGPGLWKPQAQNLALRDYVDRHGEVPEFWFTMDDDVVFGWTTLPRLTVVLEWDPSIWLAGAFNDATEPNRGSAQFRQELAGSGPGIGNEVIQDGFDFTVGGGLHALPQEAIEAMYPTVYPEDRPRHDDWGLTMRVRALGRRAVIVRTAVAAILPDDDVDPGYREWINRINEESRPR